MRHQKKTQRERLATAVEEPIQQPDAPKQRKQAMNSQAGQQHFACLGLALVGTEVC